MYKDNPGPAKGFDKVFKPEKVTLANGHSVLRPRSRLPLILGAVVFVLGCSVYLTGFDVAIIIKRAGQLTVILGKIFQPDFSYFPKVLSPLFDTIKMSLLGSIIGSITGLPVAILSSSNINRNRPTLLFFRLILSLVRTIPTLVLASICALMFNYGPFAGMVAITIFTFGVVTKMLYESIETIDMGPFEAMESVGATKFEAFWTACMPQILPTYLSHCLYCFEMNVRAASILGYVGAGGVGLAINEQVGWRDYNKLGMILLVLFITVVLIDSVSGYCRKKLGGSQ
ncbi:MAG: phosphonate ABC transporter, permease protein PhnE [Erysipelotrichaceae bacterium]|jgi:phosphonate transport system permease protein|nr:phosphonate ABC transporter, permease protein PhnE [Erysipelotrichaceae bacterium]